MRKKMLQIWLDDLRDAPDPTWKVFRSAESLIDFLKEFNGEIATLSLDHDLGDGVKTGYDAVSWIEEQIATGKMTAPRNIRVHSANPVGVKRISQAIESIRRFS
jgi:hypothetical protein